MASPFDLSFASQNKSNYGEAAASGLDLGQFSQAPLRRNPDIQATLEEYAEAYCSKDIDLALFDDGDDISLIGTGADELCAGRSAIKAVFVRNFSEATATRFEWHWKHVTVVDDCAVVAISLTIHLDSGWAIAGPSEMDRLFGAKVRPMALAT